MRALMIWVGLVSAITIPLIATTQSPLLAWREPVYIVAGFAGIFALSLMLLQPLLALGAIPGFGRRTAKRIHLWVGLSLVSLIALHVIGLWITSPPDVIDALLFVSPTPFSAWGVIAMWALFASAVLALNRFRLRLRFWRVAHAGLAGVIVIGSVVHAILVEGTMETISKVILCLVVGGVTGWVLWRLPIWKNRPQ